MHSILRLCVQVKRVQCHLHCIVWTEFLKKKTTTKGLLFFSLSVTSYSVSQTGLITSKEVSYQNKVNKIDIGFSFAPNFAPIINHFSSQWALEIERNRRNSDTAQYQRHRGYCCNSSVMTITWHVVKQQLETETVSGRTLLLLLPLPLRSWVTFSEHARGKRASSVSVCVCVCPLTALTIA